MSKTNKTLLATLMKFRDFLEEETNLRNIIKITGSKYLRLSSGGFVFCFIALTHSSTKNSGTFKPGDVLLCNTGKKLTAGTHTNINIYDSNTWSTEYFTNVFTK